MVKRKLFKFSLPAIFLTALVAGSAFFSPAILNKDSNDLTASISKDPHTIFIGDNLTFTLDVRYLKDSINVESGEIQATFEPFTVVNVSVIEEKPGKLVINYYLRCLENIACGGNKSYGFPDIIIYYVDNSSNKVKKFIVKVEPVFISAQIDPAEENPQILYPKEPVIKNNIEFFVGMFLVGILFIVFGLFGFRRFIFPAKKNTDLLARAGSGHKTDKFLERLEELRSMLLRDGSPRLIFAQSAGIIDDYLYVIGNEEISQDLRKQLDMLKKDSEDRAYRENEDNEPTKEEAAARIGEISLIISQKEEIRPW